MTHPKTYLVCPLNWGLGHAARLMPIIHKLLNKSNQVILCGDGNALEYLKKEFPELNTITLRDISIHFSPKGSIINLLKIIPQLIYRVVYEHRAIKNIIKKYDVDIIISDNRYGLWNNKIHSIFITHQLMVKLPKPLSFFEPVINKLVKTIINQYDECWIPDYPDLNNNLSGDLAHKFQVPSNSKYIGPCSHFSCLNNSTPPKSSYDIVAIISGPEPARSDFENCIIKTIQKTNFKTLIIQGKPMIVSSNTHHNITRVSSLPSSEIKGIIKNSKLIISRAGYSTIMDFDYLNIKAILIPTPGQTEQEYLAHYQSKNHFFCLQKNFNISFLKEIISRI